MSVGELLHIKLVDLTDRLKNSVLKINYIVVEDGFQKRVAALIHLCGHSNKTKPYLW
jgi:hypothetical protein